MWTFTAARFGFPAGIADGYGDSIGDFPQSCGLGKSAQTGVGPTRRRMPRRPLELAALGTVAGHDLSRGVGGLRARCRRGRRRRRSGRGARRGGRCCRSGAGGNRGPGRSQPPARGVPRAAAGSCSRGAAVGARRDGGRRSVDRGLYVADQGQARAGGAHLVVVGGRVRELRVDVLVVLRGEAAARRARSCPRVRPRRSCRARCCPRRPDCPPATTPRRRGARSRCSGCCRRRWCSPRPLRRCRR